MPGRCIKQCYKPLRKSMQQSSDPSGYLDANIKGWLAKKKKKNRKNKTFWMTEGRFGYPMWWSKNLGMYSSKERVSKENKGHETKLGVGLAVFQCESEGAQRIACPEASCSCFSVSYRTKSMFSYSTPYICIRGMPAIFPHTSKELSSFDCSWSPPWDEIAHFIGSKETLKSLL